MDLSLDLGDNLKVSHKSLIVLTVYTDDQCCGNYRSGVIDTNTITLHYKDAQLQFQLLITLQTDNYNKKNYTQLQVMS